MQSVESVHPSIPLRERLSTRLLLVFAVSFLGAMIVMGASRLMGLVSERNNAAAEVNVQTPAIVIDPKIQQELAKALAFDAIPTATQVQNPFVDRAGIGSGVTSLASMGKPNSTQAGASPSKPGATSSGTSNVTAVPGTGAEVVFTQPGDATKARYDDWLARQKRGEYVGPVSEILGVEDLVPVGYAAGGSRAAEVMLLSVSLCRTFTFPAGTRFYDGLLNGFDQREVVFIFGNGVRRKSYLTDDVCKASASSMATAN